MGLHNIPEGLALGVAFGAAAAGLPQATLAAALVLTLGIGIQNFPEGMSVSVPLRCEGLGKGRAFWYGAMTAVVEPLAAVAGAAAVYASQPLMPYALGFAAGAMIFVVVEEIAPVAHSGKHKDLAAVGFLAGFLVMMVLDTALA
jgi:ZIP family zinc transporter